LEGIQTKRFHFNIQTKEGGERDRGLQTGKMPDMFNRSEEKSPNGLRKGGERQRFGVKKGMGSSGSRGDGGTNESQKKGKWKKRKKRGGSRRG